jgi:hypothetical protein
MKIDAYTKAVLTVIAACLVWISLGGPSLVTPVQAQPDGQVVIVGWQAVDNGGKPTGRVNALPLPVTQR